MTVVVAAVVAVVAIVEVLILVGEAGLRGWKTGLEETCHKNRKELLIQSDLPVKLVRWPTQ